ncbi:MAG: tetratricopeptide repeat protein [Pseudomonadota bacterium]|uniref:tetratricopeptide repeat protein n=1 Tax=Rhizorhabdus phycosphaerae TaxID=2711156 RepID=UPI001D0220CB|nr:tetratricopeptide repeat protein [Rhizorhabdus phycosphaerae]
MEWLQQAAKLAQGPDPKAAAPLVDRLLRDAPGDADVLTVAGIAAQRRGDIEAALAHFAAAREADPTDPARLVNLAVALKQAGRLDEAVTTLRHSLDLRPDAPVALANLGSCLIAADRPEEALAPLRRAVAVKPDHVEAWNNLGVALVNVGKRGEAVEAYRRALALRPSYAEAALNLVDALVAQGEGAEAEQLAKALLAAMPGHPRASNQLAAMLDARGDLAGAIALYRKALERGPNHALGINLAMALLRAGEPREALSVCDALMVASPSITTPLALRCAALERLGQEDALAELMALDRFVTVIDIDRVDGFETMAAFDAALLAELEVHPSLTFEPEGLVTRAGRQSDELAADESPAIAALAELARKALGNSHEAQRGDDHPWLRARPDDWSLTLWGTILAPGGEVGAHIHAPNWLSGVYYPAFRPPADGGTEGWFAIGALPEVLGGGGTLHLREPRAGRMILFPSYLWHCTLPFGGDEPRISFAFDLVPKGTGNRHRLQRRAVQG